jgi:hypothetical protein
VLGRGVDLHVEPFAPSEHSNRDLTLAIGDERRLGQDLVPHLVG